MLELPTLDQKSYAQIFEEAVARIPALSPQWTDFNPQDTGILLLELMAGLTEFQRYYLDQAGEEFLLCYLRLAMGREVPPEELEQALLDFAQESGSPSRAVTPGDFSALIRALPLGITHVQTCFQNGYAQVTVYRLHSPLSAQEMQILEAELDYRRLIGSKIQVEQAVLQEVSLDCQAELDPSPGSEDRFRSRMARLFEDYLERNPFQRAFRMEDFRAEILEFRELRRLESLSLRPVTAQPLLRSAAGSSQVLRLASIQISPIPPKGVPHG